MKPTFPYFVRPGQAVGMWNVAIEVGHIKKAKVTVATGSKEECEAAAEVWNWLARGKKVRIVV